MMISMPAVSECMSSLVSMEMNGSRCDAVTQGCARSGKIALVDLTRDTARISIALHGLTIVQRHWKEVDTGLHVGRERQI